ncbi:MAG TPA: TIGR04283 family arsenosugar biosynthesis glycosyltransferase [Thermoanaerobaculia bacterium]|nr:TIGR04283 family arsenosugar biosynthesis glycosyltransferase [Thermoanaerobaculia bacterium]
MSLPVTVIIAARNEEEAVTAAVRSAFESGAAEVIVADGGSTDRTRQAAASAGARVIECQPMRARQYNRAAETAANEALVFLHADTLLPAGAGAAVLDALQRAPFGGFRLRFAEQAWKLRLAAFLINLRTRLTLSPWGDQAQFIRRATFLRDGGFREIPLMDDYELAVRMRRRGRPIVLPLTVITSGRRFLRLGLLRTTAMNWTIVIAWRLGVSEERLAGWYRERENGNGEC